MPTADDYGLFWNSSSQDRLYDAESFTTWLKKFFTTGVFQNDLQVTAGSGMAVSVGTGYCNIDGKVRFFTSATTLTIANANSSYPRIDAVVIERNDTDREITLKVVTGSISGNNPVAPEPVRSGGVYQIVLAHVLVPAGSASVSAGNITDTRPDSDLCGWVTGTVDEIDISQIMAQAEAQFDAWFNEMKGQLSEDAAGNLQNEIDDLVERVHTQLTFSPTQLDLDTYDTGGIFYFSANNIPLNTPTEESGWLIVYDLDTGFTKQLWLSDGANPSDMYVRTQQSGEWTGWSKYVQFGSSGEIMNPRGGYVGYAGKPALSSASSGQALIQGQYHTTESTAGLPDTAVSKRGILEVTVGNGGQEQASTGASGWIYQRYTDTAGRSYVRARGTTADSWGSWTCITPTWESKQISLSSLTWTHTSAGSYYSSEVSLSKNYSLIEAVTIVNWQGLPSIVVPYVSGTKIAFIANTGTFSSNASITVRVLGIEMHG